MNRVGETRRHGLVAKRRDLTLAGMGDCLNYNDPDQNLRYNFGEIATNIHRRLRHEAGEITAHKRTHRAGNWKKFADSRAATRRRKREHAAAVNFVSIRNKISNPGGVLI